jgi:hypothetical protein
LSQNGTTPTSADSTTFSGTFSHTATCTLKVVGQTSKAFKTFTFQATPSFSFKWDNSSTTGIKSFTSTGESVVATLRWSGTVPATATNVDTFKVCPDGGCTTTGVKAGAVGKTVLERLANGSMAIGQPWYTEGAGVHIRLRNAAGVALYQGQQSVRNGQIVVPSLTLAPGWYAVETELNGQHATQAFTISR